MNYGKWQPEDVPSSHTPFYFGCRDFVNSSTAKRNATFTAHTHIHMYATLLNKELMNKTTKKKNITQTFHTMSEQVILLGGLSLHLKHLIA